MSTRCGFVALIGAPNAGKSTLINALVGAKVSIVSPKAQTTRSQVLGITVAENQAQPGETKKEKTQIIFIDTPGIFEAGKDKKLEKAIVAAAWQSIDEADMVLLIVDATAKNPARKLTGLLAHLSQRAEQTEPKTGQKTGQKTGTTGEQKARPKCILALNKTDRVKKPELLKLAAQMNALYPFDATFMISALRDEGTGELLDYIAGALPPGPFLFPPDQMTTMPMRLMAAEITREKLFLKLREELPYALTVETESWDPLEDGSVRIGQVIYIERESQRKIILGKGGAMIKQVGTLARKELEDIMDGRIHLNLFVKVRSDWKDDPERLRLWNLDQPKK